jgi:hypothetical protein
MPITSIQKLMGHRFVKTTQNYAMANDKQVEADFYAAAENWRAGNHGGRRHKESRLVYCGN